MTRSFMILLTLTALFFAGIGGSAAATGKAPSSPVSDDSNLISGGQLAESQGWVYYNPNNGYDLPGCLYKMKTDGSGKQKLTDDNAMSINVSGDWIYYTVTDKQNNLRQGIYKVKTDGTGRTKISGAMTARISVSGGWIYYVDAKADTKTYSVATYQPTAIKKMKTDGTGVAVVYAGSVSDTLHVQEDWIYFSRNAKPHSLLYKIRPDGTGLAKVSNENIDPFIIVNGWVYYADQKTIYKMSLDGKTRAKWYTSDDVIDAFSLHHHDGWIYFEQGAFGIMGAGNIKKVRLDGKLAAYELKGVRPAGLYFAGSTFYFAAGWMGNAPLNRLTADGKTVSLEVR